MIRCQLNELLRQLVVPVPVGVEEVAQVLEPVVQRLPLYGDFEKRGDAHGRVRCRRRLDERGLGIQHRIRNRQALLRTQHCLIQPDLQGRTELADCARDGVARLRNAVHAKADQRLACLLDLLHGEARLGDAQGDLLEGVDLPEVVVAAVVVVVRHRTRARLALEVDCSGAKAGGDDEADQLVGPAERDTAKALEPLGVPGVEQGGTSWLVRLRLPRRATLPGPGRRARSRAGGCPECRIGRGPARARRGSRSSGSGVP